MNQTRHPTYMRRRQERLLREEDQREVNRRDRELHEQLLAHAESTRQFHVLDLAAADRVRLGQHLPN